MAREVFADLAKGAGIVLVLIGHSNVPFWLINLIYFFHMPLFVILSGIFHKPQAKVHETAIKSTKVLFTYIFYGVFFLFWDYILSGKLELQNISSFVFLKASIYSIPYFGVFWFVVVLFFIRILAISMRINYLMFLGSGLIYFLLSLYPNYLSNLPLCLGQVFLLYVFYVTGVIMKPMLFSFPKKILFGSVLVFLIFLCVSCYYFSITEYKLVNYHNLLVFNPFLALVMALSGSFGLISLTILISKFQNAFLRFMRFIGEFSFSFLALHLFSFSVIGGWLSKLGLHGHSKVFVTIVFSVSIISIFIYLIEKFLSRIVFFKRIFLFQ